MEDNYEKNKITFAMVRDYVKNHTTKELNADIEEFLAHLRNVCKSMTALYNEYKLPLVAAGLYVTMDLHTVEMDGPVKFCRVGIDPVLGKAMRSCVKEAQDGGK